MFKPSDIDLNKLKNHPNYEPLKLAIELTIKNGNTFNSIFTNREISEGNQKQIQKYLYSDTRNKRGRYNNLTYTTTLFYYCFSAKTIEHFKKYFRKS